MPFDSLGVSAEVMPAIDPLERMGITPVPVSDVAAYKAAFRNAYIKKHCSHFPQRPDIRWMVATRGRRTLKRFLADPMRRSLVTSVYPPSTDNSGAPSDIASLAERVEAEVPEATFTVEYLAYDPILWVTYPFNGAPVTVCLGIWDAGKIKMIAGQV